MKDENRVDVESPKKGALAGALNGERAWRSGSGLACQLGFQRFALVAGGAPGMDARARQINQDDLFRILEARSDRAARNEQAGSGP